VIEWFLSLDKATQAVLASAIVSALIIGAIAVLGFWITFKTSIAANERIAAITKQNNFLQLQFAADSRIAEMRQKWIDDLRQHLAEFMAEAATELAFLRFREQPPKGRLQYLYNYIFLKLNRTEEKHKKIVDLLNQITSTNNHLKRELEKISPEDIKNATQHFQKAFDELGLITSAVLKEEWIRVKSETKSATVTTVN
jgi:hypothetical protein